MGLARPLALLLAVALPAAAAAAPRKPAPPPPPVLAIVDVDVVPMDAERRLTHQTVLLQGEKILRVGPVAATYVPDDATVIPGRGLTVFPGMADMHAHLPGADGPAMPVEDYLFLQVARGVTTLRSMRGAPEHLALRARVAKGQLLGPELILGSPPVEHQGTLSKEAAQALVGALRRERFDFVRLRSVATVYDYRTLSAAARKVELPVAGHIPRGVGLGDAIAAGQKTVEHLEPLLDLDPDDAQGMKRLATELLAHGVYLCPTLDWYQIQWGRLGGAQLARRRGVEYLPRALRDAWHEVLSRPPPPDRAARLADLARAERVLAGLARVQVPLLVGTGDGPYNVPGFGVVHELRAMVGAGVRPYVALRAATHDAAAALDSRPWGTVTKGERADLVLLEGNPLESLDALERVRGVVLRGRYLSHEELEAGLQAIARRAR